MSSMLSDAGLHARVRDHYDDYYAALDDLRLEEWPSFFTAECLYRIVSRENFERGFPLSTVLAESRGMLHDRVTGLLKTQMYAPRYYRRFPGPLRLEQDTEGIRTRHNLLMMQTRVDKQPEVILCGVCHDLLVEEDGRLRFRERIVVFDDRYVAGSHPQPRAGANGEPKHLAVALP